MPIPLSAVNITPSFSCLNIFNTLASSLVMLGLGCSICLMSLFVSTPSSSTIVESLRQAFSTALIYSPLGGYHSITAKFEPLARSETCALVRGLLDKFFTNLVWFRVDVYGDLDSVFAVIVAAATVWK